MIKKVALILILFLFVFSCGKKADPEYKTIINSNTIIQIV